MARVKMTTEQATALRERPVAKGKGAVKARASEKELQDEQKVVRTKKSENTQIRSDVQAGALRGIMDETLARCYGEIYPTMATHDEEGVVDVEIREEVYILALTMVVGNDIDTPRTGLKLREDAKASANMKQCKECESYG